MGSDRSLFGFIGINIVTLAEICSDTRLAARMAYKRDYNSQEFNLRVDKTEVEMSTFIKQRNCDYHVKNAKCLKFLRNFGDLIHKLNIDTCITTMRNDDALEMVLEYVNKYSEQSHKILILDKYLSVLMEEPLQNVDHIEVRSDVYSVAELNTLIENVPSLQICFDKAVKYLIHNMPHLRQIKIIARNLNGTGAITHLDIVGLMKLNPQIQELIINIGRHNVLRLKLNGTQIELKYRKNVKPIVYALIRPEQFEIMYLEFQELNDNEFQYFLKRFINVTCLSINSSIWDIDKVIRIMPNVQKFQICCERISPVLLYYKNYITRINPIISAATRHSTLLVLSFNFRFKYDFDNFRMQFSRWIKPGPWTITFNEDGAHEFKYALVLNRIRSA